MSSVKLSREVEVRHRVDVFVAGGGPAGLAAALAAGPQRLSVKLDEHRSRVLWITGK